VEPYVNFINKSEIKTIPELKSLVNSSDEAIISVKNNIQAETDEDFARKAFDFVRKIELAELDSDVSFWLSPKEILEVNASDSFDKAIFLCSLLKSRGLKAKVRVLEFSDSSRRPIVIFELNGKTFTAEPTEGILDEKNPDDLAKSLKIDDSVFVKALFEFNDKDYEDFQQ
ncbi:MAG: hypothetical protein M1594_02160, partial [Candidatus Marsarchaeota archaeon]|nr:hypothetical protein [Candidatus Marsarchaeota archaeon]